MEKCIVYNTVQHHIYQHVTCFHTKVFSFYYGKRPRSLWKVTSLSATMGTQHRGKRRPITSGHKVHHQQEQAQAPNWHENLLHSLMHTVHVQQKIPRHVWQGILNFSGNNNKGTRVYAQTSYREMAPEGHASAQVPHSVHTSGLIEYFSPSEMAPTGHSSIHVPQATQSSPIT